MLQLQASVNHLLIALSKQLFITCNCCLADASFCLVTSSCSVNDSISLFWSLQDLTAASLACLSTSICKVFKHNWSITCYEFLTTREVVWFITLIDSVCLSVCSKALTSEVHIYTSGAPPGSMGQDGIWRSSGEGQGHKRKKVNNHPVFSQWKPVCQHKSRSRSVKIPSPVTQHL